MPLLGIEPQFFGHPARCLIMHGAILAPFIVQYGLNIFDLKFHNLNAALTCGKCKVVLLSLQDIDAEAPFELSLNDQLKMEDATL
jgi:hypothetical protein